MPQVRIRKEVGELLDALARKDGVTPDEKLAQIMHWAIKNRACS